MHRDLKPENIFLQPHDNGVLPKVLDFGLAKAFGARWPHGGERDRRRAAGRHARIHGARAGRRRHVSPAWDIWALGVITHEMLTGQPSVPPSVVFGRDEAVTTASGSRRGAGGPAGGRAALLPRRSPRDRRLAQRTRWTSCGPSSGAVMCAEPAGGRFITTKWTLVAAAGDSSDTQAREALAACVRPTGRRSTLPAAPRPQSGGGAGPRAGILRAAARARGTCGPRIRRAGDSARFSSRALKRYAINEHERATA